MQIILTKEEYDALIKGRAGIEEEVYKRMSEECDKIKTKLTVLLKGTHRSEIGDYILNGLKEILNHYELEK